MRVGWRKPGSQVSRHWELPKKKELSRKAKRKNKVLPQLSNTRDKEKENCFKREEEKRIPNPVLIELVEHVFEGVVGAEG